jgi:hypothetical protein
MIELVLQKRMEIEVAHEPIPEGRAAQHQLV